MKKSWQEFKLYVREVAGMRLILWGIRMLPNCVESDYLFLYFSEWVANYQLRYLSK